MSSSKPLHLLDLNDDCLISIFKYLTISETFQIIGLFNSRIDRVAYNRIAAYKHFVVDYRQFPSYSPWQLSVIAQHLKSIVLSVGYSIASERVLSILKVLCEHARSLRELTLHYIAFSAAYDECLSSVAPQLHKLDLSFSQITDDMLTALLQKCPNLEFLRVIGNYTLYGEFLGKLTKLPKHIEIELHEDWSYPIAALKHNKTIELIIYKKGRFAVDKYNLDKSV